MKTERGFIMNTAHRFIVAGVVLVAPLRSMAFPSEEAAQAALLQQPSVRAGLADLEIARADSQRLDAGSHEWTVRGDVGRRQQRGGPATRMEGLGIERGLRWFGKADADRRAGAQLVSTAQAALADRWHESARALLADWFAVARAQGNAERLGRQQAMVDQFVQIVQRRQKAGESARIDVEQAQAERLRLLGILREAQQSARIARLELDSRWPGIGFDGLLPEEASAGAPDPSDIAAMIEQQLRHNHEIELAQRRVELAQAQAERARRARQPDPTVGVMLGRDYSGAEKTAMLNFSIPIGGAARDAEYRAATAAIDAAHAQADVIRRRVTLGAQTNAREVGARFEVWHSLDEASRLMQRNAASMRRAYELGEASIQESLQAGRIALEAASSAEHARMAALEAAMRLKVDSHTLWSAGAALHHDEHQPAD